MDFNQGLDIRLVDEDITKMLNKVRFRDIHFAWDRYEDKTAVEGLKRYAKHATKRVHGALGTVYVLVNFDTTLEQDLERIYRLREMQYDPYVMCFDKPHASRTIRRLQRWCNNKMIFKSCEKFEDYKV